MDYSELEKVNDFVKDVKKITIGILLGLLVVFIFRGCNQEPTIATETMTKNEITKQKEIANDYKFKYEILEIENEKLKKDRDSRKAVAEFSKNNRYQLQHQKERPAKAENLIDCNDTLQAVYNWSIKKDSACNVAIQNLDNVIFSQDSIKNIDDAQKKLLLSSILVKDNLLNNSEKANMDLEKDKNDLTKSVKSESTKKNFWKGATVVAVLEIIRQAFIK